MAEKGDHVATPVPSHSLDHSIPKSWEASNLDELELLKKEVSRLRLENSVLTDAKNRDEILQQMRSRLLEYIEMSARPYKSCCKQFYKQHANDKADIEGFEVLFSCLAEMQRQCYIEEQIIYAIRQKNEICEVVRDHLSNTLKQLKKKYRRLRTRHAEIVILPAAKKVLDTIPKKIYYTQRKKESRLIPDKRL
ncbi:uncharacterized protein LOC129780538 [Toxorhynchites rutilus septentrionalis]|uniref:uncharacterized protein LOC129780538 n=1 Tax=Toxorhynchites rutilus septentrionalis TaxID=329112 RepID=UPI002478AC41|nr:uncharacterized protein LOC129780538 [Toxorhynchites rutilus septentrionalis]